jgi:hypothetical protein
LNEDGKCTNEAAELLEEEFSSAAGAIDFESWAAEVVVVVVEVDVAVMGGDLADDEGATRAAGDGVAGRGRGSASASAKGTGVTEGGWNVCILGPFLGGAVIGCA